MSKHTPSQKGQWVDFREIRERVSIEDVLAYLGVDTLTPTKEGFVGPCPVHKGDNPRAFRVDTKKNTWFCFTGCRAGGNQIDLLMAIRDCSVREAALELQGRFLAPDAPPRRALTTAAAPTSSTAQTASRKPPPMATSTATGVDSSHSPENRVIDVQLALRADHPHLVERGLRPEILNTFGVGYCSRGIMRGTIAIPVHNQDGGLVAYAGRRLKPQEIREYGKYKLPKGFRKDLELFNVHRAREHVEELGFVLLVEGYFSVMHLHQRGYPNTVAAMGAGLSETQVQLLAEMTSEVIVLFDGDDAGRDAAARLADTYGDRFGVRAGLLPEGLEPELLSEAALHWLIAGLRSFDLDEVALSIRSLAADE